MFISDFAIRRPIITVVTMIALVVFGLASLARLDTDEFPDLDQPIVSLGIAYPGAAPDVVEREVVTRLETSSPASAVSTRSTRPRPTASRKSSSSFRFRNP
jgi:HAE1 family hydrophobic/amphiphilic exporter-1